MRIRDFHVDVFGLLRDVTVCDLAPHLTIFLGRNEAGKTTLLDFFRAVLTGFPPRPSGRDKAYRESGSTGGSLTLETSRGILHLTRRPGIGGGEPVLTDADGNQYDRSEWDRIMGGISREVYTAVYGFSLTELESLDNLKDNGQIRSALYGSSFGVGLGSPNAVLDKLKKEMDALFKSGGQNQPVAKALSEWTELEKKIVDARRATAGYDALTAQKNNLSAVLEELRTKCSDTSRLRLRLERRLSLWRQWDEWRQCRTRQADFPPLPTLPEDAAERLRQLSDRLDTAENHAIRAKNRAETAQKSFAGIQVNENLADALPRIQRIGECRAAFRNAVQEMPRLQAELARIADELNRGLAALGPEWTEDAVRAAAPTFTRRDLLSKAEGVLNEACRAVQNAASELKAARSAHASSKQALDTAELALKLAPEPEFTLPQAQRDQFQRALARAEEAAFSMPEAQRLVQNAAREFYRTAECLHLKPDTDVKTALNGLETAQDEARERADDVQRLVNNFEEKCLMAEKAEQAAAEKKKQQDALICRKETLQAPDRATLEAWRITLRQLRSAAAQLPSEEARLADLEEQSAVRIEAAKRRFFSPSLLAGSVLACGGAAAAVWGWSLHPAAEGLPLTVWPGLCAVITGLLLLLAARPHSKEQAKRLKAAEEMTAKRDSVARHVEKLRTDIIRLSRALRLPDPDSGLPDPARLDALDTILEEQHERLIEAARMEREINLLDSELKQLNAAFNAAAEEQKAAENEAIEARRRWQECLLQYGLSRAPEPDDIEIFFTRLESAKKALDVRTERENEYMALQERIQALSELAAALPESVRPPEEASPDTLFAAVSHMLERCSEGDRMHNAHEHAKDTWRKAQANFAKDANSCTLAEKMLQEAEKSKDGAEADWRTLLTQIGLDPNFSPTTVRDAMQCLQRMTDLLAERERRTHDVALRQADLDAFTIPLNNLCTSLGRRPGKDPCAEFDLLLSSARQAAEAKSRAVQLKKEAQTRENEWNEAEKDRLAAKNKLTELLRQGQCENSSDFLRLAALCREKSSLERRESELAAILRQAAEDAAALDGKQKLTDAEFSAWLAAFDGADPDELRLQLDGLVQELKELEPRRDEALTQVHELEGKLEALRASGDLAALRSKQESVGALLRQQALNWTRLSLAKAMLERAKTNFERERQPAVIREASRLFALMTAGAWTGISAKLDDNSLSAQNPSGEVRAAELLSRGTREQLYLALRLANVSLHDTPPLIMDDILVNFDPDRARSTAKLLAAANSAEGIGNKQILFFTCHPETAEMLKETSPESAFFIMESGKISRC